MPLEEIKPRERLGIQLREWRKTRGLSQRWLAERAGTSQRVVSLIEREGYNPSLALVERLAEAMDMRVEMAFRPRPKR